MFRLNPGVSTKWKGTSILTSSATAEPRDKSNELYIDPTVPKDANEKPEVDIRDRSVKVFRSNVIRVKYQHT